MKTEINVVSSALQTVLPVGQQFASGFRGGEVLVTESRGKYAFQCQSGKLWHAYATGLTIPVIAAQMVSVFSLYNPIGSGVNLELVELEFGNVNATTVVNTIGIGYEANLTLTPVIANMTAGTAYSGLLGDSTAKVGQFFTAWTHVGTPLRIGPVITYGAVTNANANRIGVDFDGKIIMPPGSVVSACTSTATETNAAAHISWLEVPAF